MKKQMEVLIVGSGCSGLYSALHLPKDANITVITKAGVEENDSFLAQGGMCMLKNEADYESYFEDTMKAGHYENDEKSVEIMIRSSQEVVADLVSMDVDFKRESDGSFSFTREGAHSDKRILYHEDITGKEITSKLLAEARKRENIEILEYTTLLDIIEKDGKCVGAIVEQKGEVFSVACKVVILATGGVGGLYRHSTNFRHLTADGLAVGLRHGLRMKNIDYVQIHPTTLYSKNQKERSFLISESVRGEGAKLYDKDGKRFVNELLPRDLLTIEIRKQMRKDGTEHVWEDLRTVPEEDLRDHFPNIVAKCLSVGYDVTKTCIPVVPAQHYFMGGIWVDHQSKTSMENLYAVGETACNGVHGRNRLASNSLLESLVFAWRAAKEIDEQKLLKEDYEVLPEVDMSLYTDLKELARANKEMVKKAMDEEARLTKERDIKQR